MTVRSAIAVVALILAGFSVAALDGLLDSQLPQIVALVLTIAVMMIAGYTITRDPRMPFLIDPVFLACVFISQFFVIGPLAMRIWSLGELMFFYGYDPVREVQVLAGVAIVLVTMFAAYRSEIGTLIAERLPSFPWSRKKLSGRWIEAILITAAIAGCIGWIVFQGGLMAKLSTGYGAWKRGGAMFRIAFVSLQIGTLILGWRYLASRVHTLWDRILFPGMLAFQVVFFGIINGTRKYLLFMFFGLLTVWVLRRGIRQLPKVRAAAIAALLLVFFAVWGSVRSKPLTQMVGQEIGPAHASNSIYHGYVSGVAGPYSVACLVWELFPEVEPYRRGSTLLVTLFGFIPRAVWPEKPVGIGKEITRYIVGPFYEETYGYSAAPTVIGDFYLNAGWLGLIVGGLCLGVTCRVITSYATHGMISGVQLRAARVLIPAVFIMGLGELRADMATMLATYTLSFIPLFAALLFFNLDVEDPLPPPDTPATRSR